MRTFNIKLKTGKEINMGIDELTRWACLIEGVEQVANKCDELGYSKNNDGWIKPLAFQKYIDERFHSMKHDLTVEAMMGNI
jgi:hypothetical protein